MSSIAKALPITAKPNIRKCAHQQQALRQPAAPGTNIRPKSQLQIELQVCRARLRGKQEIPILSWVGRAWSMVRSLVAEAYLLTIARHQHMAPVPMLAAS